jgi:hypothetical protein
VSNVYRMDEQDLLAELKQARTLTYNHLQKFELQELCRVLKKPFVGTKEEIIARLARK